MRYLVIFLFTCGFFLGSFKLVACDCKSVAGIKEIHERDFEYSDLVFYGELVNSDSINSTFQFRVLELFKGKISSEIISGKLFDSCSILPKENGAWLVYANCYNELIEVSMCSASRPEKNPNCFVYSNPPIPPPSDTIRALLGIISSDSTIENEKLEYQKNIKLWKVAHHIRIHKDFEDELILLRSKKNNTNN